MFRPIHPQPSPGARIPTIMTRPTAGLLQTLFPAGVSAAIWPDGEPVPPLYPEEEACVGRAVPKRRREFAEGRACARKALEALGLSHVPLLVGPDRAPVWPSGAVGSITHCAGFVGAVVARRELLKSLGLDAEIAAPLNPDLARRICTARELAWIDTAMPPAHADWLKVFFCAKEAVYKCVAPVTGAALDFLEVEVAVASSLDCFTVRFAEEVSIVTPDTIRLSGKIAATSTHVVAGATLQ